MTKTKNEKVESTRKSIQNKADQLQGLKDLRDRGILTRQQFRTLCFDKGLQQNPNREPYSPLYTKYEMLTNKRTGEKTVQVSVQQWTRYSK